MGGDKITMRMMGLPLLGGRAALGAVAAAMGLGAGGRVSEWP